MSGCYCIGYKWLLMGRLCIALSVSFHMLINGYQWLLMVINGYNLLYPLNING